MSENEQVETEEQDSSETKQELKVKKAQPKKADEPFAGRGVGLHR